MEDRRGGLWIGMESSNSLQVLRGGRLTSFNLPPGGRTIRAMAEDRDGNMWFGTTAGMLLRSEGERLVDETPNTLAAPKPIRAMLATPDGGVWIGYANAGIGRMRAGKFSQIDLNRGCPIIISAPWFRIVTAVVVLHGSRNFAGADPEIGEAFQNPQEQVSVVNFGRDEGVANVQATSVTRRTPFVAVTEEFGWGSVPAWVSCTPLACNPTDPAPILLERVAVDGRELPCQASKSLFRLATVASTSSTRL